MSKRKRKVVGNPGSGTNGEIWFSPNFTPAGKPRRRSWPYEPTPLEVLATRIGIEDEDFRQLLCDEIQRRGVASADENPETTPGPHQHRI